MLADLYKNREIFITGGSGAVGKALIEKLLRTCDVQRIYVLLRSRKNLSAEQRLTKLRDASIFRVLRSTKPERLNKIIAIPGDVTLPNLGITAEYEQLLENISIIYHCAATVRFDEPLDVALKLNVGGTYEALKFAERRKHLELFMHVSTYFSNPYLSYVEPKIYPPPMDWKFCLNLLNDESKLDVYDSLTKKLIVGFPNTYTFTKNLAETLVNDFRDRVPVTIYRPSIILMAMKEPEPGFPPSMVGAMGLFLLVAAGILKTVYLSSKITFDITPQDIGVSSMLFYTKKAIDAYKTGKLESAPVYVTSTTPLYSYTFRELCENMEVLRIWDEAPMNKCFLIPGCRYTSSRLLYKFLVFTKEIIPAMLGDLLFRLFGRQPVLMGVVRKAYISLEVMKPFMFNNFNSPGPTHFDELLELKEKDEDFAPPDIEANTSPEGLHVLQRNMVHKIREILLKEDPNTMERARKILNAKKVIYFVIRSVLAYYILRWFYRLIMEYINSSA